MTKLSKRLAKLEATVQAKSLWKVSATEVDELALEMLSADDHDLVQQARKHGGIASLCESHSAVFNRWDAALGPAIEQTGFPVRVHAVDWEL